MRVEDLPYDYKDFEGNIPEFPNYSNHCRSRYICFYHGAFISHHQERNKADILFFSNLADGDQYIPCKNNFDINKTAVNSNQFWLIH